MTNITNSSVVALKAKQELPVTFSLVAVVIFFMASGFVSYWNTRIVNNDAAQVMHTHEVIISLEDLMSLAKDAETGQRGYLITGDDSYLEPYKKALLKIDDRIANIQRATADNPEQQARIPLIKKYLDSKLSELAETIDLRRNKGFEVARAVVVSDRGKNEMDEVRSILSDMRDSEHDLRQKRLAEMTDAYRVAVISGLLTGLLGVLLSGTVAHLVRRNLQTRQREEWLQSGQVGLSTAMVGEQRMEPLGDSILSFLSGYCDAHAALLYSKDGKNFRRVASYGVSALNRTPERFDTTDGLLGQAVKTKKTFMLNDVPDGYLTIGSAMGQDKPRNLMIAPISIDGEVNALLELGFLHPVNSRTIELIDSVSNTIGTAVKSANYRAHLQNLLEETQRQSEELQAQSEELRVTNEELEEQSRALKESQIRLEQQQAEMEQTNSQLEETAQILETQKDDLTRTKAAVQAKATELEQASQYKSDFLANMSHELRTPLNSSLILAKLLADNPSGNLTEEQIKFAQTIHSSGNDLLALINDILDLSKIEAGHMEIRPEQVSLERMMKDITRVFEPLASHKGIAFTTQTSPECPATIDTDRQRLEQVLKNLLSNAIKFTEQGSVKLTAQCLESGKITFTVADTGIGIAPEQQQAIFEAFRQADGTISRKYGGTGLGLSISRQLARLLGGSIQLESKPGQGSRFIITIPQNFDPELVAQRPAYLEAAESMIPHEKPAPVSYTRTRRVEDDRERLTGNSRVILVVEDDESFARILLDLAHELDFQCLVANTAEEALAVAQQYLPSAVVLDVGLPDNSGLSVLDRLKHDARTRHIPVHVVSAGDYAQTALSLGAVGYMLKPVKREDLSDTFKKLETRLSQRMRRVLIVEDDPVQQDSVRRLLGSHDVQTVGVGTVSETLAKLKEQTFDCMVLDLSLPDASGYELLETLSREDAYSFPPVIVYTGRDLSNDEEQRLRRYSKSIIIKGAKSPERLLDEVTLFLHQVVSELPPEQQRMLEQARNRDAVLENRRILIVEDDVRNVYAVTSIFEPRGAIIKIARNGREALDYLEKTANDPEQAIDLVLMDVMMPEMDGMTATREIRKHPEWKKLPIIMLTAKAMKNDQERCLNAGANDYMAKPLDVEKLLSLVRVWMPR